MRVLFVLDGFDSQTNGTTITARRFAEKLIELGHEVSILSNSLKRDDINVYSLKERYIPFVTEVARLQKVSFAKPNKKVILEALKDTDIVHVFFPWKLSKKVRKYAKKLNIPVTGAFHCQPENITYGAGLGKAGNLLAWIIYRKFRRFYKKIKRIHCPSQFIADELKKHKYPNQLRVISNGVNEIFFNQEVNPTSEKFEIISTGRYAKEKQQQLIIRAIAKSKYKDKIRLTLAGAGPRENRLKSLAQKLKVDVVFGFYTQSELIEKLKSSHLYVHAADIEIEGIACIEAIAVGLVPLIGDAKKSATKQFAMEERNLFKSGSVESLVNKLEYWIENPEERLIVQKKYQQFTQQFKIENSIKVFEEMLNEALFEQNTINVIKKERKNNPYIKKIQLSRPQKVVSAFFYYFIAIPILAIYMPIINGFRVRGRKNLQKIKGGSVIVSNHVHILDSPMNGVSLFPRKPIFTSIPENFEKPAIGNIVKLLGAVPIPTNLIENRIFFNEMTKQARKGKSVHVFPEGELIERSNQLGAFKRGAFKIAVDASVPIVPIGLKFVEKETFFTKKSKLYCVLTVGKPIYPNLALSTKESVEQMLEKTYIAMNELIS